MVCCSQYSSVQISDSYPSQRCRSKHKKCKWNNRTLFADISFLPINNTRKPGLTKPNHKQCVNCELSQSKCSAESAQPLRIRFSKFSQASLPERESNLQISEDQIQQSTEHGTPPQSPQVSRILQQFPCGMTVVSPDRERDPQFDSTIGSFNDPVPMFMSSQRAIHISHGISKSPLIPITDYGSSPSVPVEHVQISIEPTFESTSSFLDRPSNELCSLEHLGPANSMISTTSQTTQSYASVRDKCIWPLQNMEEANLVKYFITNLVPWVSLGEHVFNAFCALFSVAMNADNTYSSTTVTRT